MKISHEKTLNTNGIVIPKGIVRATSDIVFGKKTSMADFLMRNGVSVKMAIPSGSRYTYYISEADYEKLKARKSKLGISKSSPISSTKDKQSIDDFNLQMKDLRTILKITQSDIASIRASIKHLTNLWS
jgi:hypothetical protein